MEKAYLELHVGQRSLYNGLVSINEPQSIFGGFFILYVRLYSISFLVMIHMHIHDSYEDFPSFTYWSLLAGKHISLTHIILSLL